MPATSDHFKQFRKVGPMTLSNATSEDLAILRGVIERSAPMVKYIAFVQREENSADYHVFAHAKNKLTPACWRGAVHKRLENITPVDDLKAAIEHVQSHATFEQYGEVNTRCARNKQSLATPIAKTKATSPAPAQPAEKPDYIHRLIGHIVPRNGYLVARKTYLRIMGFSVPDDFDTSVERAREIERLLAQPKQPETTTTTVVVSNKPSAASTKRAPPRKFVRKFKYAPAAEAGSVPH
jgi:hypothetical protein